MENHEISDLSIYCQGQKIIELRMGNNIVFKDNYLYMGVRLADLPKTQDISQTLTFSTSLNIKIMKVCTQNFRLKIGRCSKKLAAWQKGCVDSKKTFNFQRQLFAYSKMDTAIISESIVKFSDITDEPTEDILPFLVSSTIARLANKVFVLFKFQRL